VKQQATGASVSGKTGCEQNGKNTKILLLKIPNQ